LKKTQKIYSILSLLQDKIFIRLQYKQIFCSTSFSISNNYHKKGQIVVKKNRLFECRLD